MAETEAATVAEPASESEPGTALNTPKTRPIGVPGTPLCRIDHPAPRSAPAQWRCRAPSGSAPLPGSSGEEGGRRRAIGGVAAVQSSACATAPMGRRWAARGGPEGRGRENPGPGQRPEQQQRPGPGQRQQKIALQPGLGQGFAPLSFLPEPGVFPPASMSTLPSRKAPSSMTTAGAWISPQTLAEACRTTFSEALTMPFT